MNRKLRELEAMMLAMFAAVPLYATQAVSPSSVLLFHLTMTILGIRVVLRGTDFSPIRAAIQAAGAAYLLFFPFDAMFLSRSLIRASGHLIFFIIVYQTVEASWRNNDRQRFLTTFLLFITSVATATHISIVLYIAGFAFLCYRHLIFLSHWRTAEQVGIEPRPIRGGRAALAYVVPTTLISALLFPILPRVRSPFVSGFAGNLGQATSGISETINFNENRSISPAPDVVARVWIPRDAAPFFTPIRLRARTYERFEGQEWKAASRRRMPWIDEIRGRFPVARPQGFTRSVELQQQTTRERRSYWTQLYVPVGTHTVIGFSQLVGRTDTGIFLAPADPRGSVTYQVLVSRQTLPLQSSSPETVQYPILPAVEQFARRIIGNATTPQEAAAKIETYLSTRFTYLANPAELGRPVSVEEFLLRERRGHCEYFAAGMVVLLTSLDIPARIVGGYYGGEFNPLTGYFVIRQRDAHAWVELWDGEKWRTYDPTPAALRPGIASAGLFRAYATALTESVNYFWDRYILTYGLGDQLALIQEAMERTRRSLQALKRDAAAATRAARDPVLLLIVFIGAAALVTVALRARKRSIFETLVTRLDHLGIKVEQSMTAYEVLQKVREERPDLVAQVAPVIELYVRDRFSSVNATAASRLEAIRAVAALR